MANRLPQHLKELYNKLVSGKRKTGYEIGNITDHSALIVDKIIWVKEVHRITKEERDRMRYFRIMDGVHKGIHKVYLDVEEFKRETGLESRYYGDISYEEIGEMLGDREIRDLDGIWIESDDGYVVQALEVRRARKRRGAYLIRFPMRTVWITKDNRMPFYVGLVRNGTSVYGLVTLTREDEIFLRMVIDGLDVGNAYDIVYGKGLKKKGTWVSTERGKMKLLQLNMIKGLKYILEEKGVNMENESIFTEEFIQQELEEFFAKVRKGSLVHLQGINFIKKVLDEAKERKEITQGDYSILPPLELKEGDKNVI